VGGAQDRPALGLAVGGLALLILATYDVVDALELWTGRDLNGNGHIGDLPEPGDDEPGALAGR